MNDVRGCPVVEPCSRLLVVRKFNYDYPDQEFGSRPAVDDLASEIARIGRKTLIQVLNTNMYVRKVLAWSEGVERVNRTAITLWGVCNVPEWSQEKSLKFQPSAMTMATDQVSGASLC